jgi:hypothetical protein
MVYSPDGMLDNDVECRTCRVDASRARVSKTRLRGNTRIRHLLNMIRFRISLPTASCAGYNCTGYSCAGYNNDAADASTVYEGLDNTGHEIR